MPKTDKKPDAATAATPKIKPLFNVQPWSCIHKPGVSSKIEAYIEAAGDWQTVATVQQTAFLDAERTADFIANAVNEFGDSRELIGEMASALDLCLECELTWEAEREAEILAERARKRTGGS